MFKLQEMRELIRLIDKSTINEFSYEKDDSKIKIKKTATGTTQVEAPVVEAAAPVTPTPAPAPAAQAPTPAAKEEAPASETTEASEASEDLEEILSPMVGTFYQKPSPESDPYVAIGDKISEDTIVCIVEAMKLFNEIEAELNGEIVEILVNDGELVEYGQPLFKVKTK